MNSVNIWGIALLVAGLAANILARRMAKGQEKLYLIIRLIGVLVMMAGAAVAVMAA